MRAREFYMTVFGKYKAEFLVAVRGIPHQSLGERQE
jgi:hypothetical protein